MRWCTSARGPFGLRPPHDRLRANLGTIEDKLKELVRPRRDGPEAVALNPERMHIDAALEDVAGSERQVMAIEDEERRMLRLGVRSGPLDDRNGDEQERLRERQSRDALRVGQGLRQDDCADVRGVQIEEREHGRASELNVAEAEENVAHQRGVLSAR